MQQRLFHFFLTLLIVTAAGLVPYGLWMLLCYGRGHHSPTGTYRLRQRKPVAAVTEPEYRRLSDMAVHWNDAPLPI